MPIFCLFAEVLQNHLLKHVICSGALTGQHRSPNLLQKMVNLTVSEDGKVFADGAQLVQTDVMATNGVMHVVDQVLVPEEGTYLTGSWSNIWSDWL